MEEYEESRFGLEEFIRFMEDVRRSDGGNGGAPTTRNGPKHLVYGVTRDDGAEVELIIMPIVVQGQPLLAIRRFEIRHDEDRHARMNWEIEQSTRRS